MPVSGEPLLLPNLPHWPQKKKGFCLCPRGRLFPSPEASQSCTRGHQGLGSWAVGRRGGSGEGWMKLSILPVHSPSQACRPPLTEPGPWQSPPALGCVSPSGMGSGLVPGREGASRWPYPLSVGIRQGRRMGHGHRRGDGASWCQPLVGVPMPTQEGPRRAEWVGKPGGVTGSNPLNHP